jgi:hypothetical protein
MEISFSTRVVVPAKVLIREVAGESIILNLNSEQYYGLDKEGTRFLAVLSQSASIQTAVDTLLAEYEVDRATLEEDMRGLLDDLIERGLIGLRSE